MTTPDNEKRLEAAKQLGLNKSELLNAALETSFDKIIHARREHLLKALGIQENMVRDTGFEPVTPTVSR